ncbi:DsbA family protein [Paenibacillus sp. sgz500958]|uniref:DsbA family protein n=1 Tax=Paenibacillus sp. sgz500958 TaxID=3242475 RepID=UPI0036D3F34D
MKNIFKQKWAPNNKFALPMLLAIVVVVILAAVFGIVNAGKDSDASELENLPNYTEVKGQIVVDGLKYEKQPHLGSSSATVKVIEFADFKCPACKKWTDTYLDQFIKDYVDTGKVEFFFMNYAFLDRDSYLAASAGEAIYKQSNDLFWEYAHKLYANQGDETKIWATEKFILDFVKKNIDGIDYDQFAADVKNRTFMFDVKEDFKIAGSYGVNGTPKFMVNGELLKDSSYESLTGSIDAQLASASN